MADTLEGSLSGIGLPATIRARFVFTAGANVIRGALGFATGLVLARWLGPEAFGGMAFLIGTFLGLRQLLDMGSSSAFFTFLSQERRSQKFVLSYFAFLAIEFVIVLLIISLALPSTLLSTVWQGQPRGLVLLAFAAAFLQNSVWPVVQRVAESQRQTVLAQGLGVLISLVHLLAIVSFWRMGILGLHVVFGAVVLEYAVASVFILSRYDHAESPDTGQVLPRYVRYCLPLVAYSGVAFTYEFADRWLLQRFGGGTEQAYYAVGSQFAAVALLGTASILNIFWKEVAEANHLGDHERAGRLYRKTTRLLFFLGASIAGFLIPWAEMLIKNLLGEDYSGGAITLGLMFLYPIHQSMGQIGSTLLMASERLTSYVRVGMAFMGLSIISTYFLLASPDAPIPGLSLGAEGLALKMIVLQVVQTNVIAWIIARHNKWRFEWLFQPAAIGLCLASGWACHSLASLTTSSPLVAICFSAILYTALLVVVVVCFPSLIGYRREDISRLVSGRADSRSSTWTILDAADDTGQAGRVFLWNGHGPGSLFAHCERNASRLRQKYCGWVHDLGQADVGGATLEQRLLLPSGLSFWWQTRIAEQSPWKSPEIDDAIRLLALEELLLEHKVQEVRLVSGDTRLDESIRALCKGHGISYSWETRERARQPGRILTLPFWAVGSFAKRLWEWWPLRAGAQDAWFDGERTVFCCSYFTYMASGDRFLSRYWDGLQGLVERLNLSPNWLQLYRRSEEVPDAAAGIAKARRFSQTAREHHGFVESHISARIAARVMGQWLGLLALSIRLRGIRKAFQPHESKVDLWPIMKEDWLASLWGPDAVDKLLRAELFRAALQRIPHQRIGLYVCENQAWERALIHAWRAAGHGRLIAVPHTARSFWDLRFYQDPRASKTSAPRPDLIAVNGPVARDAFLSENYPESALLEAEALRYSHLATAPVTRRSPSSGRLRVLVMGDYLRDSTTAMLRLLEASVALLGDVDITFKAHPSCPVDPGAYPLLRLQMTNRPLPELFPHFEVAFSSNTTAAAVDAYCSAMPLVVMLDPCRLNLSPLRGLPEVRFAGTPEQLAHGLRDARAAITQGSFFFLDAGLPRWERILRLDTGRQRSA